MGDTRADRRVRGASLRMGSTLSAGLVASAAALIIAASTMGNAPGKAESGWQGLDGMGPQANTAVFGAGCYWGTEAYFVEKFGGARGALEATAVGFMGPKGAWLNPTYEQVCTGESKHVEVLALKYNPDKVAYEELVRHFFTFHDPTTLNRQGNDVGPQYASAIFTTDAEQEKTAKKVIAELDQKLAAGSVKFSGRGKFARSKVTTAVLPATKFY